MVTAHDVCLCFVIEDLCIFLEDFRSGRCHWAVDVYIYLAERVRIFRMMLIEHVELINQFLRSAYRKGRDDNTAAALDGFERNLDEIVDACCVFQDYMRQGKPN